MTRVNEVSTSSEVGSNLKRKYWKLCTSLTRNGQVYIFQNLGYKLENLIIIVVNSFFVFLLSGNFNYYTLV